LKIQAWKQVGEDTVLQKSPYGGKEFRQRRFIKPGAEEPDVFDLYGRRNGAIVFPVTEDGKVIVVRQFRQGITEITIELPAGTARSGEDMRAAAGRELREETDYEPGELFQTSNAVWLDATNSWVVDRTFVALGCRRVAEVADNPREPIELVLMSIEEWMARAFKSEGNDSGTVAAMFYVIPHLLRRGLITPKMMLGWGE